MTPEEAKRLSEELDRIFALPKSERSKYLDQLCQMDPDWGAKIQKCFSEEQSMEELDAPPEHLIRAIAGKQKPQNDVATVRQFDDRSSVPEKLIGEFETLDVDAFGVHGKTQLDLEEEATLGRFSIKDEIARGGMGIVYRARDLDVRREIAIKTLLPRAASNPSAEARFLREARITGQLQHPGIPPLHQIGRLADGRPFLAMKLIEGQTLAELLSSGDTNPRDRPELLDIMEQICQAVAYAHSRGLIHRDLKPQNIMVGAFGQVQVMDWGLAKLIEDPSDEPLGEDLAGEDRSSTLELNNLTEDGVAVGTPSFMAPEQLFAQPLDERCDVFGLGGILCAILTGSPPIPTKQVLQNSADRPALDQVLRQTATRLASCGAESALIEICQKCLRFNSQERYANADEVAAAVIGHRREIQERLRQAELERERAKVQIREGVKRRRIWLALGVSLAVLAIVIAGVSYNAQQTRNARLVQETRVNESIEGSITSASEELQTLRKQTESTESMWRLMSNLEEWEQRLDSIRGHIDQAEAVSKNNKELVDGRLRERLKKVQSELTEQDSAFEQATRLEDLHLRAYSSFDGVYDPTKVEPLYEEAFRKAGMDPSNASLKDIANSIRKSPNRLVWIAALDHWADNTKDRDRRRQLIEIASMVDPDAWRDRYRNEEVWNDLQALRTLAREVDPSQHSPYILVSLANQLSQMGGNPNGLLQRVQVAYPSNFWVHFAFATHASDPANAIGHYHAALAIRPDRTPVLVNLGVTLDELKRPDLARICYEQALVYDPEFAQANFNVGVKLETAGEFEKAIEHFERVLEVVPDHIPSYFHLAYGLTGLGRAEQAMETYRLILKLDPNHRMAPMVMTNLASALIDAGERKEAIDLLRQATALDPELFQARLFLGDAHYYNRDWELAIKNYSIATDIDPSDAVAANNLGLAYYRNGELSEAIDSYRIAIELDSSYANAHFNLGNAIREAGDSDEAIQMFQKTVRLNPQHATAWCNLGHALQSQGKLSEALEAFERGHELGQKIPNWRYDSQSWVDRCRRLLKEDSDL